MPPVIFVTAHDRYAIQAFEVNAIDYLLKPVTRERFQQALARMRERVNTQGLDNRHVMSLLQQLSAPPKYLARVALRSAGKISFVNIEDVLYVQAAENYVQLHLKTCRHLLHVPIATLEASLDPTLFLRNLLGLALKVRRFPLPRISAATSHLLFKTTELFGSARAASRRRLRIVAMHLAGGLAHLLGSAADAGAWRRTAWRRTAL
jgi:hypothetical protein